jgi:hypothetical protein
MIPRQARVSLFCLLTAVALGASLGVLDAQEIPSPSEFFGFEMGADRQLARWDRLVEYYELIGQASDRVDVRQVGLSTLGEPFLVIFVTSPENHANLAAIKAMNTTLQDPRGAPQAEIERAVEMGKAVVVQSYGLHSTEVAASQASAEIIYEMATRTDEEMMRILDETVAIQIPAFNPDGQILVTDWYNRWVGTEYEAVGLPELYHHYIGHDNNRDAFMQNTVESQYGAQIAYGLEQEGREGIVNSAQYSGWGHFGFHWITPFHNIAGMLTESASARLATPLFVHPEQLRGTRQLPEYEAQTTFPNPWKGGWWTVRDMVINQKIATFETLDLAARNRARVLHNSYLKASRQTERGMEAETRAYLVSGDQHDPLTAQKMVNKLLGQGIEVQRATEGFVHEGRAYPAGSFLVDMAQPKRGVIRWLLGQTYYPQNAYTRNPDGSPIRPYDMSGDVLAEFMGVAVTPAGALPDAGMEVLDDWLRPMGTVARGTQGFHIEGRLNDAFRAVNLLWDEGVTVHRFVRDHGPHGAGDFWIPDAPDALVEHVSQETGVPFHAMEVDAGDEFAPEAQRLRIGMYQAYGGNMDEGWTRLLLEQFDFPYTTLDADAIAGGGLGDAYDVIILPMDGLDDMKGDGEDDDVPPGFRNGFGDEGVAALEAFVQGGGTLVTFGDAGELPMEGFDLPVRDITDGVSTSEFWAYGSTLKVKVNTDHPLAWGMPEDALVVYFGGQQVFAVGGMEGEAARRVASYVDHDILQSGQLDGEELIANKAAMLTVDHGEGQVVLIGFRTQHRAQTHGTYKFLFNALVGRE